MVEKLVTLQMVVVQKSHLLQVQTQCMAVMQVVQ